MKKNYLLLIVVWVLSTVGAFAQIVTNQLTLVPGGNLIVNQLDNGNNDISLVLQTAPYDPNYNTFVIIPNSPIMPFYDNGSLGLGPPGWYDLNTLNPVSVTLAPGKPFFFVSGLSSNYTITLSGTPHVPTLPVALNCGTNTALGRQTNGIGTFENITGLTPIPGARVYVYNTALQLNANQFVSPNYTIYTFNGSSWTPSTPNVPVGIGAFVSQPCVSNGCINVQAPATISVTNTGPVVVDYTSNIISTDVCNSQYTGTNLTLYGVPAPGSTFSPGTTPVHCTVVDPAGNAGTCDFVVTVLPPPSRVPMSAYNIGISPGLNLVAYQFNNGGNTLGEIFTNVPDGTIVSKYNNAGSNWVQSTYYAASNAWVPPNITLRPGDGAFLQSPGNFVLALSGNANTPVLPVTITNDIVLISRQTNGVGNYTNITGTNAVLGVKVYKWNAALAAYNVFQFGPGGWIPSEPSNAVGEAWWLAPHGGAGPPPVPVAPTITTQPVGAQVAQGSTNTFLVAASGTAPLSYLWRLNGNPLINATNSSLTISNIQPANCGNYDVLVQNSVGIADSVVVVLGIINTPPVQFANGFAAAGSLPSTTNGFGGGNNAGATPEPGEPNPGFIPGGAPLWVRWQAPTNGVATFSTAGSGFDTLLAVYTGNSLASLVPVASDDDSAGFLCSQVSFTAAAGTIYDIQVDGFYGASGNIILNWNLVAGNNALPIIVTQPRSQTVAAGSNATFTVATQAGANVVFQWLRNGATIPGATASSFTVSNVTSALVGFYQARVTNLIGGLFVTSLPGDLQINVPAAGQTVNTNTRAETKFKAATDQTIRPGDPYDPSIVTGYTGTQIFGAYGAVSEPSEPLHCGVMCYFTKWHTYQAPADGIISVANAGTTFDGVLGIYASNNFALQPIACSAGHGAGGEMCSFVTRAGVSYAVAMSGTNADTSGTVQLQFATLAAPVYTLLPISRTYSSNDTVTLTVSSTGNPSVQYQWQLNGVNILGATDASLQVPHFDRANQGDYTVLAYNSVGTNLFTYAPIYLNNPPQLANTTPGAGNRIVTQLMGMANSNYLFQSSTDRVHWVTIATNNSPSGIVNFSDAINRSNAMMFYRGVLPPPIP